MDSVFGNISGNIIILFASSIYFILSLILHKENKTVLNLIIVDYTPNSIAVISISLTNVFGGIMESVCPSIHVSVCVQNVLGSIKALGVLTYYHTMPHFDALKIKSCGKHCEKRRNCLKRATYHFLCFLPYMALIFSSPEHKVLRELL